MKNTEKSGQHLSNILELNGNLPATCI